MMKFVIPVCLLVGLALAMPAKDAIDKATQDDIELNDVLPDKPSTYPAQVEAVNTNASEKQIEGTSSEEKEDKESGSSTENPVVKPQESAGSAIARIIDDIFQIPITVLQSVAKLLTSPFLQTANKTPVAA